MLILLIRDYQKCKCLYFEMKNIKEFENKIICGDCMEEMRKLPSKSIDLIVTDPPFFILKQIKNLENVGWDKFKDIDEFMDFTGNWLDECYRVLKKDSQLYTFWSQRWMKEFWNLKQAFEIKRMLIWNNPCKTRGFASKMYLWNYTPIFFLSKGKIKKFESSFLKQENVDVFRFPAPQSNYKKDKRYHPVQKPLKLVEILVKNSSNEGDIVLDPFMGAGTILVACKKFNRRYIGIDINPRYCEIAKMRLEEKLAKGIKTLF